MAKLDSLSPADLAAQLSGHLDALARELTGTDPTSRSGTEIRFRGKGSLAVAIAGPKRGNWYDHEASMGGDALGLVAHLRGVPMREAYHWALGWLGLADGTEPRREHRPAVAPPPAPHAQSNTVGLARRIWREAEPAAGTLVEAYLASRGLTLPPDAPLRFHPACPRGAERHPAMISLMTTPTTNQPCGIHRTFLRADGAGKADGVAKMMAGEAGIVRLVPDEEVTTGLGLAEGIETALSVMQRFGWLPVWAALSAGGLRTFPVFTAMSLTIFADQDDAGMDAANVLADRWNGSDAEARICTPPAGDFNDLAQGVA